MPVPEPHRDEVLVRVSATGICGTDLHIYRWDPWARAHVHPPRVIGHEFTGTVVALGDDVTEVAVGDRIAGECHVACGLCHNCRRGDPHICERLEIIGIDRDGAFAEYVRMPARNAWRLHDDIPTDVAAVMDPLGNAVHTALATELTAQAVLITGCGPIGLMAIAICKMAGAAVVVASDVNTARLSLARTMGADLVLDSRAENVAAGVHELTDGQGADVVLEMSGHPGGIADALRAVRRGGWVEPAGFAGRTGGARPRQRRDLQRGADPGHLWPPHLGDVGADEPAAAAGAGYHAGDHAPAAVGALRGGILAAGIRQRGEGDPDH